MAQARGGRLPLGARPPAGRGDRLTIAVPAKGRLREPAVELLEPPAQALCLLPGLLEVALELGLEPGQALAHVGKLERAKQLLAIVQTHVAGEEQPAIGIDERLQIMVPELMRTQNPAGVATYRHFDPSPCLPMST